MRPGQELTPARELGANRLAKELAAAASNLAEVAAELNGRLTSSVARMDTPEAVESAKGPPAEPFPPFLSDIAKEIAYIRKTTLFLRDLVERLEV